MKSIVFNSLRAFFVALFSMAGVLIAACLFFIAFAFLVSLAEEDTYSSNVKLMADAEGNRKKLSQKTPVLLQLDLRGEIGKDDLKGTKIENLLLKSREDEFKNNRVKGILLLIDSPGGDANQSDIIFRHLMEYKERYKVPVYAYVDGLCASGGYYIAVAADKIYASSSSVIGSIGVLSWPPFFNLTDLLKKVGVNTLTLSDGIGKDEMNPFRPWKEDEQKNYKELIGFFYNQFVDIVASRRPLISREDLKEKYGAKVFPAPLAKEHGYIDGFGYDRARVLKELKVAAGLKESESYQVVSIETTKQWLRQLFIDKSVLFKHKIELPEEYQLSSFHMMKYLLR